VVVVLVVIGVVVEVVVVLVNTQVQYINQRIKLHLFLDYYLH